MPVNQLLQPIENVVDNYVNHTNTADVPIGVTKATAAADQNISQILTFMPHCLSASQCRHLLKLGPMHAFH